MTVTSENPVPTRTPPIRPHSTRRGLALIALSSVFFGSSGVIGKPAMLAGLAPEQVAAARILIAAVVLLVGVGLTRPSLLRVRPGEWRLLAAYGLLGVAAVQLFFFIAASRLPVGVAILLEFSSPVLIALWVRFVRGQHLPRAMWAGVALAMTGLALVCRVTDGIALDTVGLLAGMGAALGSAAYFLLGEHGADTKHPLHVITWGMTFGAAAICCVSQPWEIPLETLTKPAQFGPWQTPVLSLLIAVALFSTVAAYLTGIMALKHLPASAASVLGLAEPLVATTLAWALLSEELAFVQLIGAVVLLTGAAIVQLNSPGKVTPEPLPEVRPAS